MQVIKLLIVVSVATYVYVCQFILLSTYLYFIAFDMKLITLAVLTFNCNFKCSFVYHIQSAYTRTCILTYAHTYVHTYMQA